MWQGIVVDRNYMNVKLKDQDGKIVTIHNDDIEHEYDGKSTMPAGLTKDLKPQEFLDLVRFLSELGRPGPFEISTIPKIYRWQVLKDVPQGRFDDSAGMQEFGQRLAGIKPQAWLPIYARVSGTVPLDEAAALVESRRAVSDDVNRNSSTVSAAAFFLQGEAKVTVAGEVTLNIEAPPGTIVWIKSTPFADSFAKDIRIHLPRGTHSITLRVPNAPAFIDGGSLRVQLAKSNASRAQFEPVGGHFIESGGSEKP